MGTKLRLKNDRYSFSSQIILPLLVFAVIAAAVAFLLSLATSHVWVPIVAVVVVAAYAIDVVSKKLEWVQTVDYRETNNEVNAMKPLTSRAPAPGINKGPDQTAQKAADGISPQNVGENTSQNKSVESQESQSSHTVC